LKKFQNKNKNADPKLTKNGVQKLKVQNKGGGRKHASTLLLTLHCIKWGLKKVVYVDKNKKNKKQSFSKKKKIL
jgi:hypothetical protein